MNDSEKIELISKQAEELLSVKKCIETLSDKKSALEEELKGLVGEGGKVVTAQGHTVSVSRPSARTSLKADLVKLNYPDVYAKCISTSMTKPSLRIMQGKGEACSR